MKWRGRRLACRGKRARLAVVGCPSLGAYASIFKLEPRQDYRRSGLFFSATRVMIGRMPASRPRLNWSRPLPRPLVIPDVMKLATLADVRVLINKHLPKDRRDRRTWRLVTAELDKAAAGADTTGVAIALRLALIIEHVECLPQ